MQSIQATPAARIVRALEVDEFAQLIATRRALREAGEARRADGEESHVHVTIDMLKSRAIQATEESQVNKGIDHTLHSCGNCATSWRSREFTLCPTCPTCEGHVGDILFLDYNQRIDVSDAVFDQKEPRAIRISEGWVYAHEQLVRELDEFRALLEEYAPWYDKTSRKLIQACHSFLCRAGGTSSKVAIAIHFFEEEWARASDDEKTFCPEVKQ